MNKYLFLPFIYFFTSLISYPIQAQDFIVEASKVGVMSNTFLTGVRDLNLKHSSGWVNNLGTITVSRHITNIGMSCPKIGLH
ncbi:MAG: hypothetical protein LC105_07565 [Chitinophagales bacterium]|nr:hypothetical protein [Chitinophagales bacterium]